MEVIEAASTLNDSFQFVINVLRLLPYELLHQQQLFKGFKISIDNNWLKSVILPRLAK